MTFLYIILAFVVLMLMILIHELGHYTAGKIFKFKINEFAIGMGPKLFSKTKKNGEVVSLRALPLGGFCAFEGEDQDVENPNSFNKQKPWKRLIVLFSGAFFNFISAILIGVIMFSCFGDVAVQVSQVYEYAPPANIELLKKDDIITQINGREVYIAGDFSANLSKAGNSFSVTVIRDGKYQTIDGLVKETFVLTYAEHIPLVYKFKSTNPENNATHKLDKGDQIYKIDGELIVGRGKLAEVIDALVDDKKVEVIINTSEGEFFGYLDKSELSKFITVEDSYTGVGMATTVTRRSFTFGESLGRVVPYCFNVAWLVLRTLGQLITGAIGLSAVGGPISTIGLTSQVIASGFANLLSLIVMISINLAVFNLLPIPALDGCRMIFVLIEWIRGKPINRNVEGAIHAIGLLLIFAFVIVIDLLKL